MKLIDSRTVRCTPAEASAVFSDICGNYARWLSELKCNLAEQAMQLAPAHFLQR